MQAPKDHPSKEVRPLAERTSPVGFHDVHLPGRQRHHNERRHQRVREGQPVANGPPAIGCQHGEECDQLQRSHECLCQGHAVATCFLLRMCVFSCWHWGIRPKDATGCQRTNLTALYRIVCVCVFVCLFVCLGLVCPVLSPCLSVSLSLCLSVSLFVCV